MSLNKICFKCMVSRPLPVVAVDICWWCMLPRYRTLVARVDAWERGVLLSTFLPCGALRCPAVVVVCSLAHACQCYRLVNKSLRRDVPRHTMLLWTTVPNSCGANCPCCPFADLAWTNCPAAATCSGLHVHTRQALCTRVYLRHLCLCRLHSANYALRDCRWLHCTMLATARLQ